MINNEIDKHIIESERVKRLHYYDILDTDSEDEFDRITNLAATICESPISLISLIDESRQWFKSNRGIDIRETERNVAFCNYTIKEKEIFEVEDAICDERFSNNPFVVNHPNIRFYAGCPLIDTNGYALGSLCVIDSNPKKLNKTQKNALELLSKLVVELIVSRRQKAELINFEKLFNASNDLICIANLDGFFKKANPVFEKLLGWDLNEITSTPYVEFIHENDLEETLNILNEHSKSTNCCSFEITHRFKSKYNEYKLIHWTVSFEPKTNDLYGIGRDITEIKERENQIIKSEEYFRNYFENSQGILSTHDLKGNFLSVNNAFAEALGYTKEEVMNLGLYGTTSPEYQNKVTDYLNSIVHERYRKSQVVALHKDGSKKVWLYQAIVINDSIEGTYILGNALDITERYLLEKNLQKTQEMLEESNKIAQIGCWEYDIVENETYWSSTVKEIFGLSPNYKPSFGDGMKILKNDNYKSMVTNAIENAINFGTSANLEIEIKTKQDSYKWCRLILNSKHVNGFCVKLFGTFQDIDHSKKSELAIINSKKLLEDVINATTEVSIISTGIDGYIKSFNSGAEKLLGYKSSEVVGKETPERFHLKEEVDLRINELSKQYNREFTHKEAFVTIPLMFGMEKREWTYIRKDGSKVPVSLVVLVIYDEDSNVKGFMGIATDLTDLKTTKNELQILATHLKKQNDQLTDFAHITSHNLRSPVSNLNSLLNLYNITEDEEDKKVIFRKFELVIAHLSNTLNDLVEAVKIQTNSTIEKEKLSFEDVFNKTKEMLAGQILESGIEIETDFTESPTITYPRSYLESIFLNLLSNSIKYRDKKRNAFVKFKSSKRNDSLVLSVTDNGLGIDLKKHGHKLFGLNKTFHRNTDSKGLGLFITKTQIEALGGKISAESEVGEGSTFIIVF
jgi:PAS domain S-box-containing protein